MITASEKQEQDRFGPCILGVAEICFMGKNLVNVSKHIAVRLVVAGTNKGNIYGIFFLDLIFWYIRIRY